jgi:hypothetical protein
MRTTDTTKAQKNPIRGRRASRIQRSELQISQRPQFRASDVMAYALALYNFETKRTVSQTMNMALHRLIPAKYIAQAEQLVRNGKEQTA